MSWKILSIPAIFIFLHAAEVLYPYRTYRNDKWRLGKNISFVVIWVLLALFVIEQPVLIWAHQLILKDLNLYSFISRFYTLPSYVYIICSFLILDYVNYLWHRMTHAIPFLWRLHQIHHSDLAMDSSSVFRIHTLETILHYTYKICTGILVGINMSFVTKYELLRLLFSFFHHSNACIPNWIDKNLRGFIITPSLHINHHMADKKMANTNFGSILTIWDILHKTQPKPNYEQNLILGIETHQDQKSLSFLRLLFIMPFSNLNNKSISINKQA